MSKSFNCLIMGAAGRDFHDFQTFFSQNPAMRVRAFTATQIPFIAQRVFPRSLAGEHYEQDLPIYPESQLAELIERFAIDFVFLAYSDLSHQDVMHKASLVQACGASFVLLGPRHTQLTSSKRVIAVTATRTGAGKSPLSQWLARRLNDAGLRVGVIRHPMPYGQLERQAVERFATAEDLARFDCTIEEREEYEPYLEQGLVVFAGVNYRQILAVAEAEADVILWDGGNNDYSFIRPDLSIVVTDALRSGHETSYYPGETNFRGADIIVINKVQAARPEDVADIYANAARLNPRAELLEAGLEIDVEQPEAISGRRALVVEDGPTLTHGGMGFGAGTLAAKKFGAAEIIDPRDSAVGALAEAFRDYPHLGRVLPALGYSQGQREDLARTIEASRAEVVVDASPARLDRLLDIQIPIVRVRYHFQQIGGAPLWTLIQDFLYQLSVLKGAAGRPSLL